MADTYVIEGKLDTAEDVKALRKDVGSGKHALAVVVVDSSGNDQGAVLTELLREALPSCVSSTQIFANAPAGTKEIWLTIRTAGLTIRTDGGTAAAGADDHDFAADSSTPFVFKPINQAKALLFRAIQNGGTAAGRITYWG